jgi:hypothetical protein
MLVGYDLNKPVKDYPKLIDKLKRYPGYWHYLDSTWLVRTDLTHKQVRDQLKTLIDADDELLVVDVTGDAAAWTGFSEKAGQWIKDHL